MEAKEFEINIDSIFTLEIPEDGSVVVYIPTAYFNDRYKVMHRQLKDQLHRALKRMKRPYASVIILPDVFKLERIDKGQYVAKKENSWILRSILLSLFNIMTTILLIHYLCG